MENKKLKSPDFKNWLWISSLIMDAFSKQKVSQHLRTQLLEGERKHQCHRIFLFLTVFTLINIQFVMFLISLKNNEVTNYFVVTTFLIIGFITMIILINQTFDAFRKYILIKDMLDPSEQGQLQYVNQSQNFIAEISRILDSSTVPNIKPQDDEPKIEN